METQIGSDIATAVNLLRQDELVAIPTETVYGLAANALHESAVLKIYAAKNRPRFNPLILHLPEIEAVSPYIRSFPEPLRRLALAFWPGSLTLLLPRHNRVPELVTAGSNRVAVRVPNHPLALALLQQLDFPLAAPSANPSGYVSPTTAAHVLEQLQGRVPYILDGGPCAVGLESTIAGMEGDELVLYRAGGIGAEQLQQACGLKPRLAASVQQSGTVAAPGQLKSHYATKTPLFLAEDLPDLDAAAQKLYLRFSSILPNIPSRQQWLLAPDGSLETAARNLFGMLRQADASGADCIIAELVPNEGIGLAINDRLRRAQHRLKGH